MPAIRQLVIGGMLCAAALLAADRVQGHALRHRAQATSWWVPESTVGFMVALAMILLGMALLTPAGKPGPRRGPALAGRA